MKHVTASSRGIGRAAAEASAGEGARLTICARTEADVAKAAEQIRARSGVEILALQADVTKAEDIERIVRQTLDAYMTRSLM